MNIRDLHDLHDDGQPPSADILAGEYVLGVLDAAKAEGRLRTANILLPEMKQMFRFAVARLGHPAGPPLVVSQMMSKTLTDQSVPSRPTT